MPKHPPPQEARSESQGVQGYAQSTYQEFSHYESLSQTFRETPYEIKRTCEFPPRRIKSLLGSNPLKSKLLIGGLGVRLSPLCDSSRDSSRKLWFKKICAFVSSNWGPSAVYVRVYPWDFIILSGEMGRVAQDPKQRKHERNTRHIANETKDK